MKKFLAMLLVVLMALALVACQPKPTEPDQPAQSAEPAQSDEPVQTDEPVEVPRILAKHEKKPAAEIDEVEPIPEMLEVGNDFVRRAEK